MSTQNRSSGGGGGGSRNQKKSNSASGGGSGVDSTSHVTVKKTEATKTEKEKVSLKPTAEQLRIAQITNTNFNEDPQMSMKVTMLLEMTQRSEEDVCCALNECDYDLDAAVNFLLESLPVGAFETTSKKKKNKVANTAGDAAGGDADWGESNANTDKREKSRNRSGNRGGRGGTDSRGWRGREARENERNQRDSRVGDRDDRDRGNDRGNYRNIGGGRNGPGGGGSRGGGYVGRSGRGGGRMGGRGSGVRGERGSYGSRNHASDDHQEVELWDNTIAQNAEKQQHHSNDDAWGDWNNEEYEGSLKDSKVFTTSNLQNQTAASVVSSGIGGDLSAPPGLEHHLNTTVGHSSSTHQQGTPISCLGSGGNGLTDENSAITSAGLQTTSTSTSTPLMYSAAVSNPAPQLQQPQASSVGVNTSISSTQYNAADTFSNAASAAATLVQQVQQQQQQQQQAPLKSSATLSAEQSQYFNSLTSQNTAASAQQQQQQSAVSAYAQNANYGQNSSGVQFPTTYANVFGSTASNNVTSGTDQAQLVAGSNQVPQVRRARAKLPPPSKIPSSAVEMPGDNTLNNIGYLDVQFGGLDFGTDDSFDALPEKFNTSVTIDGQSKSQDVGNEYQNKQQQQQPSLSASLQSSQIGDSLTASGYAQRATAAQQQQQVVSGGGSSVVSTSNQLDQLTKNDPYNQSNTANSTGGYQNTYQTSVVNKSNSAYQPGAQAYNSSSYANVQSSVASSYQPQSYGAYQQNSVNSYQQQQQQSGNNAQNVNSSVTGSNAGVNSSQNIPVGSGGSQSNTTANSNTGGYLSSSYSTQQSAYQSSQSVYGNTGLSNSTGYAGSTSNSTSQYSNFSTSSSKLKDSGGTASSASHYESVSSSSGVSSSGGSVANAAGSGVSSSGVNVATATANSNNNNNVGVNSSSSSVTASNNNVVSGSQSSTAVASVGGVGGGSSSGSVVSASSANNNAASSVVAQTGSAAAAAAVLSSLSSNKNNSSGGNSGAGGGGTGSGNSAGGGAGGSSNIVPTNIQMVSQYIQTGLPYYQQPVYSYEELQMMQQRVPHVQGYYDLNYTPTSLGAGRDNLGSVAYSTMTDGRFARTDNNSSPVSNVSSTMSQQAGSSGPMLNVPYAYFYGGNVMPGGFQYGTPAIYPQQIPAANTASGGQFPKPSYNTGYGSTSYDTLSQASQDYTKGGYSSSVNQPNKTQNVSNQAQAGTGSDITSSMYGKGHVALNKVNSYEKQNFHSGTPPPFNMPNTQTAGMYLPMPATGHHNMIHQPIHQMDGRIHNSSRRDSNSTGQRQQTSSQSKSAAKQGYSPSYWTGQN